MGTYHSKVEMTIASHHWIFIDNANVKKIGFRPNIQIQDNTDAIQYVLKLIK